ncbi:hypothetical protein ASPZODRAFT_677180 [Penicilliopsis zonata CBS 506.65]|uniref:Aldehyde dehydrogenase domain-containing protein n=1 Tax=Penicilliopsis zonata CBS 506.65 TaxID=1073090 RepID=A0A1L9SDD6_9EURO|nr:hypothetical protein ASPZODRAFT_677180 [Penicilliopsis zonata CBS 506.65]OJJ45104.1 hypothetical protein ASPZODRAFT_677180 [Penicilliopsis zonata CBS 506.65]
MNISNFINGSHSSPSSSPSFSSINPQTNEFIASIPLSSSQEIDLAVQAAHAAFPRWSATSRAQRSAYLTAIADAIHARHEEFAVWESRDQGKTLARARVEVDRAIANFRYFATFILHETSTARFTPDERVLTYEHRSARGVFALISPWNMPLYLLTWKIAPCLAFGCTGVAKPSELTSITAYLLSEIFVQVRLPPGVMNIVYGDGSTGADLVRHGFIQGISFTGGTQTGIRIRQDTAADIQKHLSLELGGKNATIVFDDADLDAAVDVAAKAAFENQGEICLCGSRIYIHQSIYHQFVSKFVEHVSRTYIPGDTLGAVISLAHYNKIRSYLTLAKQEDFLLGGVPPENPTNGYWISPCILKNNDNQSPLCQEEIFGPVVTVSPFDTEEEAVSLANDSKYGLAAILLTKDGARMRRVGERLQAGLVWVNCWLVRELGTPFGGMKASGVGREGGSILKMCFVWFVFCIALCSMRCIVCEANIYLLNRDI